MKEEKRKKFFFACVSHNSKTQIKLCPELKRIIKKIV
jgi:hypothetical protein